MSEAKELALKLENLINNGEGNILYIHHHILEYLNCDTTEESFPCKMLEVDFNKKTAVIEFKDANFKAYAGQYKLVMMK